MSGEARQTTRKIEAVRVHRWGNIKTGTPAYGVQVFVRGEWMHVAAGGNALIFKTEALAQAKADEIIAAQARAG